MNIHIFPDYHALSSQASSLIISELKLKPNLLLCTATGNSPTLAYQHLAEAYQQQQEIFSELRIIKLDEWGGVSMDNPQSCEAYLRKYILTPLHISPNRYLGFDSKAESPEKECDRINQLLVQQGSIDVCVLGLGINGHIAFNEPATNLEPYAHVAKLSSESMQHSMSIAMNEQISYGLTLGMANILQSKLILILVSGEVKREIAQKFLSGKITSDLPASLLWLHHNTICLIDEAALGRKCQNR